MTPFLQHVATDLRRRFGADLSRVAVVFPNKRASLFFNEYLTTDTDVPVWAPRYITISELFCSLTSLREADKIETVCRLYRHYVAATGSTETLDFFYGWGERLLADFDDVDKNRADASRLFRNLGEVKALEADSPLDEAQERVIREFFKDFSTTNNSEIRTRFLQLWNAMLSIYQALRAELEAKGEAYEGQLYRRAVEALEAGSAALPAEIDTYVVVGFNVLNCVEMSLFKHLKTATNALFYWDYDTAYVNDTTEAEAGIFIRRNMAELGSALPPDLYNNLLSCPSEKNIEFVSCTTENAAAASVTQWLTDNLTSYDEKRTAIVLCNETLLQPVLHALPSAVKEVNVTKGFPLGHTPAFALVDRLSASLLKANEVEAKRAREQGVMPSQEALLSIVQQLKATVTEEARRVADGAENEALLSQLYAEAYFETYKTLGRFENLVQTGLLRVTLPTLLRLIMKVLRSCSVPFHGEPAVGLQIMGVLETRCLDFDRILMLSVNEGQLPERVTDNSFIPYDLRREFGLTTSTHKVAVYAYYFYRLIQRAERVRMVYNSSSDGLVQGEMSRFMTQLLVETPLPIRHFALTANPRPLSCRIDSIEKPSDLIQRLTEISPSAINNYLRCQLRFYFERVAGLKQPDPPATEIAPNVFGTVFHRAAELLYTALSANATRPIQPTTLKRLLEADDAKVRLLRFVHEAFSDSKIERNVIVEEVVVKYLQQLLRYDASHDNENLSKAAPIVIDGLELNTRKLLHVPVGETIIPITLKGNIDRLDHILLPDGLTHLRVIDYKTGGLPEEVKASASPIETLFTPGKDHPHYTLQTFLYALTLLDHPCAKGLPITPQLFFVHRAAKLDYSPFLMFGQEKQLTDFRPHAAAFEERLVKLLEEMLNPAVPFRATDVPQHCTSCPMKALCGH